MLDPQEIRKEWQEGIKKAEIKKMEARKEEARVSLGLERSITIDKIVFSEDLSF